MIFSQVDLQESYPKQFVLQFKELNYWYKLKTKMKD